MFPHMRFGVHTGLQHTSYDVLRPAWRKIEDLGFDWISIWDHFYGATGKPDDAACFEAVAMHAALAADALTFTVKWIRSGAWEPPDYLLARHSIGRGYLPALRKCQGN